MNYDDMLQILFNEEMQDIDLEPITQAIGTMASKDYWVSKNKRLEHLLISEEVARILVQSTLGFTYQIQELIGRIAPMISKGLPYKDMIKNASDVIEAAENHVYEVQIGSAIMVKSFYKLNQNTYDYIRKGNEKLPLRMVPRDWTSNDAGGYYTTDTSVILGGIHKYHKDKQALDVLNKLQKINWSINPMIANMPEEPNKTFKDPSSHEQFKTTANIRKAVVNDYLGKDTFLSWSFDMRGRMYVNQHHITIQGTGWQKACLDFTNKQLITGKL
jgi:DNA-directed RNA polymerase